MQGSVAPVYISHPQAEQLLVPVKTTSNGCWLQSAHTVRPLMTRNTAILMDNGAKKDLSGTELWPVVSAAPMVSDGYLTDHSRSPVMDDQWHLTHMSAPVYALPQQYASRPMLYQYPGQAAPQHLSSMRPMVGYSSGYQPLPVSGMGWPGLAQLSQGVQLRPNAAFVTPPALSGKAQRNSGYVTYASCDYTAPQSPAPSTDGAWMAPPDSLLQMFKSNPSGVKLSLEDIIGHVLSFCKDQDGSKLLQKLLKPLIVQDTTSVSLQLVIAEMEPHALKLMKHIYGRFVFIAFLGTWGSKYRSLVVDWMHGHFHELATDRYGYAVVKEAIKNCDAQLRLQIARELHPNLSHIAEDAFGHDVVCVLTESIPTADLEDAINVLVETLNFQNQYSCSVAMALLDAMAYSDPRRSCIITKMRLNAHVLAKSSRGILMLERLLDIGTAQEATDVAVMLIPNLVVEELTDHSCAVLLKSLERGGAIARSLFVAVVLQGGQLNIITHLMSQEYGKEVLQEVLQVLTGLERDALASHMEKVSTVLSLGTCMVEDAMHEC